MGYRYYKSYSAQIRKSDHIGPDDKPDLHVHIYYNERRVARPVHQAGSIVEI